MTGQILTVVAGLIGIAFIRAKIRTRWPFFQELHLDVALVVLLLAGVVVGSLTHVQESQQSAALEREVELRKPRRLSPIQRERLTSLLKNGPKGKISLFLPFSADSEMQGLAAQFEECLGNGGWTVTDRAVIPISNTATGIFLEMHSIKKMPPRADHLLKVLKEIGVEIAPVQNPETSAEAVELIIARKPEIP